MTVADKHTTIAENQHRLYQAGHSNGLMAAVRFTKQDLTEEQQAQARANIGIFTYNFTIINEESSNPADAKAIDHIVHNWQKQPMDIYVQGYPVIGLDKDNRHMMVLYHDRYISTLTWEVDISLPRSKLSAVSRRQLADTAYVDKMLGKIIINGDTLTWDGNKEGRAVVEWTAFGVPYYAVHVSDVVLDLDDIPDGGSAFVTYVGTDGNSSTVEIAKTDFRDIGFGLITFGDVISVPSNWVGQEVDGWGDGTVTFPKAGLYFSGGEVDGEVHSITIPGYVGFGKGLDPSLLPENPAKDYIVEQGRSGGWDYRKWVNGDAECWRTVTATVKPTDWKDSGMMSFLSYGLFWTKDIKIQLPYPFAFAARPVETACMTNGTVWFPLSLISTTGKQTDKTDSYRICTYKQPDQDIEVTIAFHVVGKWK